MMNVIKKGFAKVIKNLRINIRKSVIIFLFLFSGLLLVYLFYFPLFSELFLCDIYFIRNLPIFQKINYDAAIFFTIFRLYSIPAAALQGIFFGIWLMILDKLKTNTARLTLLFLSLLMSIPLSLGVTELAFYVWSIT